MGWAAEPLVGLEVGHGGLEGEGCHANSRKNISFFCLMGNLSHLGLDLRVFRVQFMYSEKFSVLPSGFKCWMCYLLAV